MPVVDEGDTKVVVLVCILNDEAGGVVDIGVDGITDGMDSLIDGLDDGIDVNGVSGSTAGVGDGGAAAIEYILIKLNYITYIFITIFNYYSKRLSKIVITTVVNVSFNTVTPWLHNNTVVPYFQCLE